MSTEGDDEARREDDKSIFLNKCVPLSVRHMNESMMSIYIYIYKCLSLF